MITLEDLLPIEKADIFMKIRIYHQLKQMEECELDAHFHTYVETLRYEIKRRIYMWIRDKSLVRRYKRDGKL